MGSFCEYEIDGEACGAKAENRDLGLCATHNKLRMKLEKPAPERKVYQMPRATAPINPVSKKKAVALREKAKAYAIVDATQPHQCVSCGRSGVGLTHSHVLPVGNFEQHEANPENILLECQRCHMVWEHNKRKAAREHLSWGRKMLIIQKLEPLYFNQFMGNFPDLFTDNAK